MSSELWRRVGFTIGALLVFRLGTYIPLPGLDLGVLSAVFGTQSGAVWRGANLTSGGAAGRLAIFSLSLTPYLTAAILLQLLSIGLSFLLGLIGVSRPRPLAKLGARGRQRLHNWTIGLTLAFAVFQSFGIALALEGINRLVVEPGWLFRVSTVVTLTGGTVFMIWLSSLITARGVGNGIALILLAGIVLEAPAAVAGTLDLAGRGLLSETLLVGIAVFVVALTAVVVVMEGAQRRLAVDYAPRQVGTQMIAGRSDLVFKLNGAGAMPVLMAPWLMLFPLCLSGLGGDNAPAWWRALAEQLQPTRPLQLALFGIAIFFCAVFYTAFVLDPEEIAADLKSHGGTLEGVAPGAATAEHVDDVLSHTTSYGAVYLALVCLVPEILIVRAGVPFYFGGTSLLIVVCAMLDLQAQIPALNMRRGELQ